jgi:hypothetical protein
MKLIFENWRRFLNENSNISENTERLLSILVNLKKFKSTQDFISRTKLLIDSDSDRFFFTLLIDDKVAGMVTYRALRKDQNCRPKPYRNNTTYVLKNIARDGFFKGYGVGRLIAFLSACYISGIDGSITSDRNTSDKAGKQLVDSLKMLGAKQSEEFDYVGYFVNGLEDLYLDDEGRPKPFVVQRLHKNLAEKFSELVKKVIDHLKPLTPEKDDDCMPSVNLMMNGEVPIHKIFKNKSLPDFMEKVLTMSSEELQQFFNSDDRVQGYTFTLPDMMINAGLEIINSINASYKYSPDEKRKIVKSGINMFKDVYHREIGSRGRARNKPSLGRSSALEDKLYTTARAASEFGALKEEKK